MPPSHQRLESDDRIRRERHNRLVEERELASIERLLQVAFQLQLGSLRFQNCGVEDFAV